MDGVDGRTALAAALSANQTITCVRLQNRTVAVANAVAEALATNTSIKDVYVDGEGACDDVCSIVVEAIARNTTCQTLHLDCSTYGHLSDATGLTVVSALKRNMALTSLDMRGDSSKISDQTGIAMAEAIAADFHYGR